MVGNKARHKRIFLIGGTMYIMWHPEVKLAARHIKIAIHTSVHCLTKNKPLLF